MLDTMQLVLPFGALINFLMIVFRMSGLFAFVSIPGLKAALDPTRIVLVLLLSALLFPLVPTPHTPAPTLGSITVHAVGELALGLLIGVTVALLQEGFALGAQILSLQAGYSYSSTIDPSSNADSTVLQAMINLSISLFFLAIGLDRVLLRILSRSFETNPLGQVSLTLASAQPVIDLGAAMFALGLRVAMPLVALLLLVDIAISLLSRVQSQLQLMNLSFPMKMLATIAALPVLCGLLPSLLEKSAANAFEVLAQVMHGGR